MKDFILIEEKEIENARKFGELRQAEMNKAMLGV